MVALMKDGMYPCTRGGIAGCKERDIVPTGNQSIREQGCHCFDRTRSSWGNRLGNRSRGRSGAGLNRRLDELLVRSYGRSLQERR